MTVASALDQCEEIAGKWRVLIDRNRCEGKEKCAQVCPEGVFASAASRTMNSTPT